jgi:4-hydroxy-L-threonine phosphate dehydrogenase PdxA
MPNFVIYNKSTGEIYSRLSGVQDISLERAKTAFAPFNPHGGEIAQITDEEAAQLESLGTSSFKYNAGTKKIEKK